MNNNVKNTSSLTFKMLKVSMLLQLLVVPRLAIISVIRTLNIAAQNRVVVGGHIEPFTRGHHQVILPRIRQLPTTPIGIIVVTL